MENFTSNYHTHTVRCRHASGSEREYVEAALAGGLRTLGFSDHAPYIFPGDYYSNFRMRPEELGGYVETLLALREEYSGRIDIRIGLEAEYYPACFGRTLELLESFPIDYLILGQHFLGNEYDGEYSGAPSASEKNLAAYVEALLTGLSTGKFACVAHPDLINYTGSEAVRRRYMLRLCEGARAAGCPLEVNLLGFRGGRHYPDPRFFAVAAEAGCEVIIGSDAHSPDVVCDAESLLKARSLIAGAGLTLTDRLRPSMRK